MHDNKRLIEDFYASFGRRDAEGMIACYAPDVVFSDPVFPHLVGEEAFSMWRMLAERAADLRVEASGIEADETTGRAHWDAYYTFSATGCFVHNVVDARFEIKNGKIVKHTDSFDLRRWASQALGLKGERAKGMWRMLCERGKDLVVEYRDVAPDGSKAHWEAHYTFSTTGRKVHNIIDAAFEFRDGKIVKHTDSFDLYRWTRLALGPVGTLLGWTPLLQGKLRKTAASGLDQFLERKS